MGVTTIGYQIKTQLSEIEIRDCKMISKSGYFLWWGPEILNKTQANPTLALDIYAYSIVLWEIMFEREPFEDYDNYNILKDDIINKDERPFIPDFENQDLIQKNYYDNLVDIIKSSWQKEVDSRPDITTIISNLQQDIPSLIFGDRVIMQFEPIKGHDVHDFFTSFCEFF